MEKSPASGFLLNRTVPGKISQIKAPDHTHEEVRYLKHLIDDRVPVRMRLSNNEEVTGIIEFYDARFIRITREDAPNLFVFKQDIKYLYELA
jgi:sRNA-binding regulator protein Hfq